MHHLQLSNTAFEGRNSVYLLGTDDSAAPTTLVDTGVATEEALASLTDELAAHGVAVADLDRILLTHWHQDHAGLAGELQAESGATVYAHEADVDLIEQDDEALDALYDRQRELLEEWALPPEPAEEMREVTARQREIWGEPAAVTPLTDGDVLSVSALDLEVVHLPGHAEGLIGFVCEREGHREGFLGDALLPKYTPNVGGADVRVDRPLATYLDSLARVEALDLDRVWPGHRGPIFAPDKRARDIQDHHDERTERVLDVLRERGPSTAWEVSAALFGELHSIHIIHGPGEAYAHLDHLVREGVLEERDGRYALLEAGPADESTADTSTADASTADTPTADTPSSDG